MFLNVDASVFSGWMLFSLNLGVSVFKMDAYFFLNLDVSVFFISRLMLIFF